MLTEQFPQVIWIHGNQFLIFYLKQFSWIYGKLLGQKPTFRNTFAKVDGLCETFEKRCFSASDDNRNRIKQYGKKLKNAKHEHTFCKLGTKPTVKKVYSSLKFKKMENQPIMKEQVFKLLIT